MTLALGLLIPLLGTMLGAAFVFFMKDGLSLRVIIGDGTP
jgi:ZIP family zinc transporter